MLVGLVILGAIVAAQVGGVSAGLAAGRAGAAHSCFDARGRAARHAREARHSDLRHHRRGRADLALPRRADGAGRRARHGARRRDLSAVGLIPVFLGLMGPHCMPNVADSEQIVPRLAEVLSAGRALRRLRRRHHLGHPVGGARGPARAGLADLPQHRRAARSRPRPIAASCGPCASTVHGAQRRRLSHLAALRSASRIWSRRHRPSAAPACSWRRCLRCSPASAGRERLASVAAGMLVWAGGKYVLGSDHALSARPAGGLGRLRRRRCMLGASTVK